MRRLIVIIAAFVIVNASVATARADEAPTSGPTVAARLVGEAKGVAQPSGPSTQWSYCNGAPVWSNSINFYDNQGYCGSNWAYEGIVGRCFSLFGEPSNNQAAALYNTLTRSVTVYNSNNCDPGTGSYTICANCSHPNLYTSNIDLGNRVTSYWVH